MADRKRNARGGSMRGVTELAIEGLKRAGEQIDAGADPEEVERSRIDSYQAAFAARVETSA